MNQPFRPLLRRASVIVAGLVVAPLTIAPVGAATALADDPLFATVKAPANLLLTPSVEWPTASTPAYLSTNAYDPDTTYSGYFDADKCYVYRTTADVTGNGVVDADDHHFAPHGAASSHACASSASLALWSGNYLNWATTQTLDAFRFALTGGYRHVDTASHTILAKTYHAGYGGYAGMYPDKVLGTGVSGATPFNWASVQTRIWNGGQRMWFTGTNAAISDSANPAAHTAAFTGAVPYTGQNSYTTTPASDASIYEVQVRVRVCDATVGLEANCATYGSNAAKPEGLIQKYADRLRYAAIGYLNDSSAPPADRNGGVLRARMKFVGPVKPVWGASAVSNTAREWDAATGVYVVNPDSADVTATISGAKTQTGLTPTVSHSGVINYINKFGLATKTYKSKDPVGELYYAGLRYLRNVGNVANYSDLSDAPNLAMLNTWIDDFPVIQTWTDPILYSCQKNFVLGIGDVYTWNDGELPGSILNTSTPPTDTAVNVKTSTNMVGQLEGIANLAGIYLVDSYAYGPTRKDTYYMAGLAYDAHTMDIRPDLPGKQTVSTYWVDVMEGQRYESKNQYWLAAKYGGFDVPADFSPYAAGNGPSTLPSSAWTTTGDLAPNGVDPRPANYFTGGQADKLIAGLTAAFERIVSEVGDSASTALANASPNISSTGSVNYQSDYDPASWSGALKAVSLNYDASDNVTTTTLWEAGALLDARSPASRFIVTSNGTTALEFTESALSSQAPAQWATFSAVPGVASTAQNAAHFLAYLRGDRAQEKTNGGVYRPRAHLLGDIVNSKLTVVTSPGEPYSEAVNPGYAAFRRAHKDRTPVVYAGANDGMMHAFNGATSGAGAGAELFAYIPSFVYGSAATAPTTGLASLGNSKFTHHYFVDGTPVVADIDFNRAGTNTAASSSDWRSVLIGGLGKGGKGYYAIDVSDPSSWTSQAAVKDKVLWEFTAPTMGHSFGNPVIVKTRRHGWVAILTSGYGSSDGKGYIYFVHPQTGVVLDTLATPAGSLAAPIDFAQLNAFIPDLSDHTATELYVGDIQGNLWRVDIGGNGAYPAPTLWATLKAPDNTAQPITTAPRVMIDPTTSKRYVMVGTGRLLDDSDITDGQTQSFYALIDGTAGAAYTNGTLPSGASFPVTRAQLTANTNPAAGIGSAPSGPMGWYIDLGKDATTGIAERVSILPTANKGIVGFAVNLPNGQVCNPSGSSYVMGLKYNTGQSVVTNTAGAVVAKTATVNKIVTDLVFNNVSGRLRLVAGHNDGSIISIPGSFNPSSALLRLNWREVPTNH